MTTQQQQQREQKQRDWFQQLLSYDRSVAQVMPDALQPVRDDAGKALVETRPISHKQEAWRYSRVENLFELKFKPRSPAPDEQQDIDIEPWCLDGFDSLRLVFINGHFSEALSDIHRFPDGVRISSLRSLVAERPDQISGWFDSDHAHNQHIFSALNSALLDDGLYLRIPSSTTLEQPIEVIYLNDAGLMKHEDSPMLTTRNRVVLETGARASLVERYIGCADTDSSQRYFHNHVSDIVLHADASLEHIRIQDEHMAAWHLSHLYVSQDEHSEYQANNLAFGGAWARTDIDVRFNAPGADCDLSGLYSVGDGQLIDFHLDVQHLVPECRSRERFKGILYGSGRAVFDGHILVAPQAQHSDAALTNDNLLLAYDAEVDTKPQLEIYADDVKCSHGTTVGRLDSLQMYYLRSRGIAETEARKMLCQGYVADIIENIDNDALRKDINSKLKRAFARLEESGG